MAVAKISDQAQADVLAQNNGARRKKEGTLEKDVLAREKGAQKEDTAVDGVKVSISRGGAEAKNKVEGKSNVVQQISSGSEGTEKQKAGAQSAIQAYRNASDLAKPESARQGLMRRIAG